MSEKKAKDKLVRKKSDVHDKVIKKRRESETNKTLAIKKLESAKSNLSAA